MKTSRRGRSAVTYQRIGLSIGALSLLLSSALALAGSPAAGLEVATGRELERIRSRTPAVSENGYRGKDGVASEQYTKKQRAPELAALKKARTDAERQIKAAEQRLNAESKAPSAEAVAKAKQAYDALLLALEGLKKHAALDESGAASMAQSLQDAETAAHDGEQGFADAKRLVAGIKPVPAAVAKVAQQAQAAAGKARALSGLGSAEALAKARAQAARDGAELAKAVAQAEQSTSELAASKPLSKLTTSPVARCDIKQAPLTSRSYPNPIRTSLSSDSTLTFKSGRGPSAKGMSYEIGKLLFADFNGNGRQEAYVPVTCRGCGMNLGKKSADWLDLYGFEYDEKCSLVQLAGPLAPGGFATRLGAKGLVVSRYEEETVTTGPDTQALSRRPVREEFRFTQAKLKSFQSSREPRALMLPEEALKDLKAAIQAADAGLITAEESRDKVAARAGERKQAQTSLMTTKREAKQSLDAASAARRRIEQAQQRGAAAPADAITTAKREYGAFVDRAKLVSKQAAVVAKLEAELDAFTGDAQQAADAAGQAASDAKLLLAQLESVASEAGKAAASARKDATAARTLAAFGAGGFAAAKVKLSGETRKLAIAIEAAKARRAELASKGGASTAQAGCDLRKTDWENFNYGNGLKLAGGSYSDESSSYSLEGQASYAELDGRAGQEAIVRISQQGMGSWSNETTYFFGTATSCAPQSLGAINTSAAISTQVAGQTYVVRSAYSKPNDPYGSPSGVEVSDYGIVNGKVKQLKSAKVK